MRVEPMKPMSKSSGIKCLNLKHDIVLSSIALNFNFRRYIVVAMSVVAVLRASSSSSTVEQLTDEERFWERWLIRQLETAPRVGRCRLNR